MKRFIPIVFALSMANAADPKLFVMSDTNGVLAVPSTFISSNAATIAAALPAGSITTNQINSAFYTLVTAGGIPTIGDGTLTTNKIDGTFHGLLTTRDFEGKTLTINGANAAGIAAAIRGAVGQTGNIFEVQASNNATLFGVGPTGAVTAASFSGAMSYTNLTEVPAGGANPDDTSLWPDLQIKDDGNGLIYVRMPWSAEKDLRLSIYRAAAENGIVDFNNADLIGVGELITTTNTVKIGDMTDEFCPFRTAFQGTLDGGHRIEINKVTKSGHGLTTEDVGKTWNIQNGRICALWSVAGDDFFLVWRKYTSGTATDVTAAQSTITSMTPFSTGGSTQGPEIDITGATVSKVELINSCTNVTTEFLVDGITQLVSGEFTPAKSFVISCRRNIIDPREWYYRCTNSVGTVIDLLAGSTFFNRRSDITYFPWGQIYLKEVLECTSAITVGLGNTGIPLQKAIMPAFSGVTSRFWWIPDTVGLTPDVSSPVAFSSLGASVFAYDTNWVDGLPPDIFVQFGSSSTNLSSDSILASTALMYDPEYYDTRPSVRSANIRGPGRSAFEIRSSTLKLYPSSYFPAYSGSVYSEASAVGDTLITAGSHVYSPAPDEGLIIKAITKTDKSWLIYFGWNSALGIITPSIPEHLQNLPCTSFRASGGSLVSTATSETITINASSAVGYLIVNLGRR